MMWITTKMGILTREMLGYWDILSERGYIDKCWKNAGIYFQWVVWLTSLSHNDIDVFFLCEHLKLRSLDGLHEGMFTSFSTWVWFDMKWTLYGSHIMTKIIMVHSGPFGPLISKNDLTDPYHPFWTVRWLRNPAPPNGW
jgi:hypothetical protein